MNIEELATALYDAKKTELAAKEERLKIEDAIAALVETDENGSKTVPAGALKITVKRGLSYKADIEALAKLVGAPLKVVPSKVEFDEKAYEAIRTTSPAMFAKVSAFVTTTPRKVSVELKLA